MIELQVDNGKQSPKSSSHTPKALGKDSINKLYLKENYIMKTKAKKVNMLWPRKKTFFGKLFNRKNQNHTCKGEFLKRIL
jgi:hypothetical protein